jgi:hypothetical protein
VVEDGAVRAGPVRLPVPPGCAVAAGTRVRAGVRAEHLRLGPGDAARVVLAERAGHDHLVHLRCGEATLLARPDGPLPAGESVGLEADAAHVRLFDAETGAAL